jgi:glycosyltransferase involved in cell wall biosynthesis
MKRVLIITNHRPDRSPGQRFRFEQYLDYLSSEGFIFEWDHLLNEKDDAIFYSKNLFKKTLLFIKLISIRLKTLRKVSKYDAVFIFREAFVVGGGFFEKQIAKRNSNIIFDFDDAIWINNVSEQNKRFEWLKSYSKTKDIIALSKTIIAGNSYLAEYAKQFNKNVHIIPTTIDTKYHVKKNNQSNKNIVNIGWTGTASTLKYFEDLLPVLQKLKLEFKEQINFIIIVDIDKYYPEIDSRTTLWNKNSEIIDLNKIDIGIMPLPNTEWAKGKCGFKGLQYMSLGIPTVMSPVGVNKIILTHKKNGFLAESEEAWYSILKTLIIDSELRNEIGKKGKTTIKEHYSLAANKNKYLTAFS